MNQTIKLDTRKRESSFCARLEELAQAKTNAETATVEGEM